MQDDREVYLDETIAQADNLYEYFISFIGASEARYPWTIELIGCGLSIGNLVYLHYKDMFKRVRPSVLCPGLIPPFGPPAHPAFPSGHSMLGHLIRSDVTRGPDPSRTLRHSRARQRSAGRGRRPPSRSSCT